MRITHAGDRGMRRIMSQKRFRGQAMVEFAIVSTIFFSLIFGIIEGGRLLFTFHQVNHAAREGARYAVAHGSVNGNAGLADIEAHIASTTVGLSQSSVTVQMSTPNGNTPRQPVTVAVSYDFQPVVSLVFGSNPITITADSTMLFHY
jgi:Flp pilus assembly protein TadG